MPETAATYITTFLLVGFILIYIEINAAALRFLLVEYFWNFSIGLIDRIAILEFRQC
jgi:hypothetical protein